MSNLLFNIAGPCIPGKHYTLDPLRGISNELTRLIDGEQYFVIHAARQSGKTTLLKELVRRLNAQGKYYALYCSLEALDEMTDPEKGMPAIVKVIKNALSDYGLPDGFAANADYNDTVGVLKVSLTAYCRTLHKPLIILFDEADCLSDGTMITFLRQLRYGYIGRPDVPFVHSVALVGLQNIYDYKSRVRPESASLKGGSPFDIITESLNLRNFTKAEVIELYAQHTAATGQAFEPQAIDYVFEQTQGQPWLVNAVAREAIIEILQDDNSQPVTLPTVEQAVRNMIVNRNTHFQSLLKRLEDNRVRRVMLSLVQGDDDVHRDSEAFLHAKELGLIKIDDETKVAKPANPMYAEIIVRAVNSNLQSSLEGNPAYAAPNYLKDGRMNIDRLLEDFQIFWRENSEIAWERFKRDGDDENIILRYKEAAPHFVMQAFLQRVVNGRGQILREMALGKKRCDLGVVYDGRKYPVEVKIKGNERSREESLKQISDYADVCGSKEGWLVIVDRDAAKSWEDKLFMKAETYNGKKITVVGC